MTSSEFPLHLESKETFALARNFLRESCFDDSTVCRVLGIEDPSKLGQVNWDKINLEGVAPALRWCLDIFVRGGQPGALQSKTFCNQETWGALQSLGLVQPARNNPAAVRCPVWLYPVDGFVIVSDRPGDSEDRSLQPGADIVFPAIYGGTLRFLKLLPPAGGGDALDLCGGTGIGALHLLRSARSAVTADITPRSAFFAEFNARFNGGSLESSCGDLYAPFENRQFDVITAHPPFVPSAEISLIYRDAGDTGEDVTRRIIEGLPAHLRAGGTCVVLCIARDTREQPFEQRARGWLGGCQDEFDMVLGVEKILSVDEVINALRDRKEKFGQEEAAQMRKRLESLATRHFVYGALALRRYHEAVKAQPLRVQLTPEGGFAEFDRLLRWRSFVRGAGFWQWLADSRPRLARALVLTVRHVMQDGELTPSEFIFSVEDGVHTALRPDGWIVPLAARFDGTKSPKAIFESAREAGELPEGFELEPFLKLLERMIGLGLVEVDFPRLK